MIPTDYQLMQHAESIMNTPEHLANALILAAGQWNDSGQQDEHLERVAGEYFMQLQKVLQTDRQGVLDYLYRMDIAA